MSTNSQMHTSNAILLAHVMWRYAQAQRSRAGDLLTTRQSMTSQQLLGSQYEVSPLETGPGKLARGPAAAAAAAQLPERPEDLYNDDARSGSVKAAPTKRAPRRHGSLAFHVPVIYLLGPVYGSFTPNRIARPGCEVGTEASLAIWNFRSKSCRFLLRWKE